MNGRTVIETCPGCGSLDVRVSEPRWFRIELERRDALDDGIVARLEFACRECSLVWR